MALTLWMILSFDCECFFLRLDAVGHSYLPYDWWKQEPSNLHAYQVNNTLLSYVVGLAYLAFTELYLQFD